MLITLALGKTIEYQQGHGDSKKVDEASKGLKRHSWP